MDGISYVCSLDEGLPEVVNLDAYISIVHDRSLRRQAILAHQAAIDELLLAADPTPEMLERSERILAAIGKKIHLVTFRTPKEVVGTMRIFAPALKELFRESAVVRTQAGRSEPPRVRQVSLCPLPTMLKLSYIGIPAVEV